MINKTLLRAPRGIKEQKLFGLSFHNNSQMLANWIKQRKLLNSEVVAIVWERAVEAIAITFCAWKNKFPFEKSLFRFPCCVASSAIVNSSLSARLISSNKQPETMYQVSYDQWIVSTASSSSYQRLHSRRRARKLGYDCPRRFISLSLLLAEIAISFAKPNNRCCPRTMRETKKSTPDLVHTIPICATLLHLQHLSAPRFVFNFLVHNFTTKVFQQTFTTKFYNKFF